MRSRVLLLGAILFILILVTTSGHHDAQAVLIDGPGVSGASTIEETEALITLAKGQIIAGDPAGYRESDQTESDGSIFRPVKGQNNSTLRADASGVIAFSSSRVSGGLYDVLVQDAATREVAGLANTSGNDLTPVWSPDGRQLVFASDADGDLDIYLRKEDGSEVKLTNNTADDLHPSWSPDGRRILFSSNRAGSYFQIYTMDLSGQNVIQIGVVADNNAMFARYSPTGTRIAFMRASIISPLCEWNWDIWLMDTDGDNQRRVTTFPSGDLYPNWTPDGRIIYASCRNIVDSDLVIVHPDTGAEFKLTNWLFSNEWAASYSADGANIVFNTDTDGNSEIYVAPAGGGAAENYSQNPAEDLAASWTSGSDSNSIISGRILSEYGTPLANVLVNMSNGDSTHTNDDGVYRFTNLPAGLYVITPSEPGYSFDPPSFPVYTPPDRLQVDFSGVIVDEELKLTTKYAPYLYRHKDELYWPVGVKAPVNAATLYYLLGRLSGPSLEQLGDDEYNEEKSYLDFPCRGPLGLLNFLCNGTKEGAANYWNSVKSEPAWQPVIYAHVIPDVESYTVIQYWLFYFHNPSIDSDPGLDNHEGDWELVQIVLDKTTKEPVYAMYSEHGFMSKRLWRYVDKEKTADGEHPKVYYAKGVHASYFKPYPYRTPTFPLVHDEPGATPVPTSRPVLISGDEPWLKFKGRWGLYNLDLNPLNDGYTGPSQRDTWNDPLKCENIRKCEWDELALHNLNKGFCRTSYDKTVYLKSLISGKVTGWFEGAKIEQIPTSEYIDNDQAFKRTVMVHEPLKHFPYWCFIKPFAPQNGASPTAGSIASSVPISVTFSMPDYQAGQVTTVEFSGITMPISATGIVSATVEGEYRLFIDEEGDGTMDMAIEPSTIVVTEVDFTAPATINDLSVEGTADNSVTLRWTAPGDDGDLGTAAAYDIRYYEEPLTSSNWVSATQVISPAIPSPAGTVENVTITGLPGGTHYFAVQAIDDVMQYGQLSNVVAVSIPHTAFLPLSVRGK